MHCIFYESLSMHRYKIVVVQKLDAKDKPKRKAFAELMLQNFDTRTCPLHL